jgi:prepilin-type N-terminal cleavage/methylation domain-containing protein/prepilin-type processing-associated H-X9-DG protein
MRRAFTLIELLVVIAIIAILAAILFPVFAQAKQSAKAAASISNSKQIATASIMYSADYDDVNHLDIAWTTGTDPVWFGSPGSEHSGWARLIKPYTKNDDLLTDPLTMANPLMGWPSDLRKQYWPHYGYNATAMAPTIYNTSTGAYSKAPRSQTALAEPANTVSFASHYTSSENTFGEFSAGYYYGNGTIVSAHMVNVPVCDATTWYKNICFYGASWGTGSYIAAMLGNKEVPGALTGGSSLRAANGHIVVFADGHVKKLQSGGLAAGTNYNKTLPQASVVVNDLSKYLWDDL